MLINVDKNLEKVNKFFKERDLILEIILKNYENYNFYIRINYMEKENFYKIFFIDLDTIFEDSIEKYIMSGPILNYLVNKILIISCLYTNKFKKIGNIDEANYVSLKIKNKFIKKELSLSFNKYIPKEYNFLADIFVFVFNELPKKLDIFLFELLAELTNSVKKYENNARKNFDLFNDDLKLIFDEKTRELGKIYYEKNWFKYLEKIGNNYYALIADEENYFIEVDYDKELKELKMSCSCQTNECCSHLYAVLLAIKNKKKYKKFCKVKYIDETSTLIEDILNFEFYFCIGINDKDIKIVDTYGNIMEAPLKDYNGKCNWVVLEDEEGIISKKILAIKNDMI